MLDLNNMSRTDLMKRIDIACNAFSEIHKANGKRQLKEWDLSDVQARMQRVLHYNADVGWGFFFNWFCVGFFVAVCIFIALSILIDEKFISFLVCIVSGAVFASVAESSKRKKLNKKFQKQVKEYGTLERLQNEIREAQRQLAIAENEVQEVRRKNASVIKVFPSDYQSLPKLQAIYQILYNQRAVNWAGAVSLYLQDERQKEKMQEEIRHNQQMEQVQQQYVKAQEKQWEAQLRQNEEMMKQRQQIADEISGQIADINMKLR